jgi:hypothetical protein
MRLDRQVPLADWTQPDSWRIGVFVDVIDDPLGIAVGDPLFRFERPAKVVRRATRRDLVARVDEGRVLDARPWLSGGRAGGRSRCPVACAPLYHCREVPYPVLLRREGSAVVELPRVSSIQGFQDLVECPGRAARGQARSCGRPSAWGRGRSDRERQPASLRKPEWGQARAARLLLTRTGASSIKRLTART